MPARQKPPAPAPETGTEGSKNIRQSLRRHVVFFIAAPRSEKLSKLRRGDAAALKKLEHLTLLLLSFLLLDARNLRVELLEACSQLFTLPLEFIEFHSRVLS